MLEFSIKLPLNWAEMVRNVLVDLTTPRRNDQGSHTVVGGREMLGLQLLVPACCRSLLLLPLLLQQLFWMPLQWLLLLPCLAFSVMWCWRLALVLTG